MAKHAHARLTQTEQERRKAAAQAEAKRQEAKKEAITEPAKGIEVKPESKAKRIGKYDPSFVIRHLKPEWTTPKRNGRNPYTLYQDKETIGDCLKRTATAWNNKPGIVPLDFWWDSAARDDEEKSPRKSGGAIIKIVPPDSELATCDITKVPR